jgi:Na+/proline symporter
MDKWILLAVATAYFGLLWLVSKLTSSRTDNEQFFLGGRKSPWYVVAFGMIGATISGVSFVSVPGWVAKSAFSYMEMTLGFFLGYLLIAFVLLPLYYKLKLVSIYGYLHTRLGIYSYKTGSAFFILSRLLGSSLRFYLAVLVLETFVLKDLGVSYYVAAFVSLLLVWLYTHRSGMGTVVWTDSFQTAVMLAALLFSFWAVAKAMDWTWLQSITAIQQSPYSQVWFFDFMDKKDAVKQIFSGVLVCLTMTGLDQDMMQKNLTCRNLRKAQTNMLSYAVAVCLVNLLFLSLGVLLYLFAQKHSIDASGDTLFPILAKHHLGPWVALCFFVGIIAAAYSSADSSLTSLTTCFCIDVLGIERRDFEKNTQTQIRKRVHLAMAILYLLFMFAFKYFGYQDLIDLVFKIAAYTYGPLLGLYLFGFFSKSAVADKAVPFIALASPLATYFVVLSIETNTAYRFAYEYLAINALLTIFGLHFSKTLIPKFQPELK